MTDKPILSVEEKIGLMRSMADNDWVTYVESLIRAHVVKALDGIELPKEFNHKTDDISKYDNYTQGYYKAISEVKQAIQNSKEVYL